MACISLRNSSHSPNKRHPPPFPFQTTLLQGNQDILVIRPAAVIPAVIVSLCCTIWHCLNTSSLKVTPWRQDLVPWFTVMAAIIPSTYILLFLFHCLLLLSSATSSALNPLCPSKATHSHSDYFLHRFLAPSRMPGTLLIEWMHEWMNDSISRHIPILSFHQSPKHQPCLHNHELPFPVRSHAALSNSQSLNQTFHLNYSSTKQAISF